MLTCAGALYSAKQATKGIDRTVRTFHLQLTAISCLGTAFLVTRNGILAKTVGRKTCSSRTWRTRSRGTRGEWLQHAGQQLCTVPYYSIALTAGLNEAPKQPLDMYSATDLQHAREMHYDCLHICQPLLGRDKNCVRLMPIRFSYLVASNSCGRQRTSSLTPCNVRDTNWEGTGIVTLRFIKVSFQPKAVIRHDVVEIEEISIR